MPKNKTLRTLINTSLYLTLFTAMCYVSFLLAQYRTFGFGVLGRFSIGVIAALLFLAMLLILDFRNKIFEAKTIWSQNLTSIFFLNLFLSFALWAYTFAHLGSPETVQNGLWCWWSFHSSVAGLLEYHYFHPLLGIIGLVISILTFCNVKYRLKRADYYKTPIEFLPIIVLFILIVYHYNHIPKPYNLG